jgi:hypothetical protein
MLLPGKFILDATDETTIIRALSWLGMCGRNACVIKNGPRTRNGISGNNHQNIERKRTIDVEDCVDIFDSLRFKYAVVEECSVVYDNVDFETRFIASCEKVSGPFQRLIANVHSATTIFKT